MRNKKTLMLPLILCELYWALAYLIYRFGVVEHPFKKDLAVAVFVFVCGLCFALGYIVLVKYIRKKRENVTEKIREEGKDSSINISGFLWIALAVAIITAVPNCYRYTGEWFPPLIATLMNPGETYLRVTGSVAGSSVLAIFDFFPFVIFPLTFFGWNSLGKKIKIVSCIVSVYYLIIYCSCGRNMPIIYFFFSVLITFFVMICSGMLKNKKAMPRSIVIVFVMFAIAAIMFKLNLASRTLYSSNVEEQLAQLDSEQKTNQNVQVRDEDKDNTNFENRDNEADKDDNNAPNNVDGNENTNKGSEEKARDNLGIYLQYKDLIITNEQKETCEKVGAIFPMYTNPYTKSYVKTDDPVYRTLPESLRFAYVMGSMYLSSSYHVLSVAMRMDFQWTYGMGCSEFLMDYFKRFTGIDIKSKTYGYRAVQLTEPPIVSTYGWSTAYVQFASDLTFPGVLVLFVVLGALTGLIWIEVISTRNICGIPLMIEMALLCLFIPANCITFCSGGYFTTFLGSLILFVFSLIYRKKYEHGHTQKKNGE